MIMCPKTLQKLFKNHLRNITDRIFFWVDFGEEVRFALLMLALSRYQGRRMPKEPHRVRVRVAMFFLVY